MLRATRASVKAMRRWSEGERRSHAAWFVGKQILRHRLFTFHSARRAFKGV